AVKRQREILPELGPVGQDSGANLVEGLDGQAAGIGSRLEHEGRYRTDQHGLGHAPRAVATDIAGDFTTSGGVADVERVLQVERFDERSEERRVGKEGSTRGARCE